MGGHVSDKMNVMFGLKGRPFGNLSPSPLPPSLLLLLYFFPFPHFLAWLGLCCVVMCCVSVLYDLIYDDLCGVESLAHKSFWNSLTHSLSVFFIFNETTVAGLSSLISIPFVILALVSGFPACFLYFIPSGLVGSSSDNSSMQ